MPMLLRATIFSLGNYLAKRTFIVIFGQIKSLNMKIRHLSLLLCVAYCFISCKPQPTHLMIDLVSDASALYDGGYQVKAKMQNISHRDFAAYQYAAIRSSRPTFGWIVPDMGIGTMQTAYHIVVDDNREDASSRKGKVWNSGEVQNA